MPRWTPEARAKQAALIHSWQPWNQATGPRTSAGKAKVARNADNGKAARRRESRLRRAEIRSLVKQIALLDEWKRVFDSGLCSKKYDRWEAKHCRASRAGPNEIQLLRDALEGLGPLLQRHQT
jgi:hypothetical protein